MLHWEGTPTLSVAVCQWGDNCNAGLSDISFLMHMLFQKE